MDETTILLSPSPGDANATPDFLATVAPSIPQHPPLSLPFEVILDGYTREPWSSYRERDRCPNGHAWQCSYLVSTDGRNRLPGFLKYLRERKKSAVARFEAADAPPSSGGKAVLVVPHDPPPMPANLPAGVDASNVMFVQYLNDDSVLRKGGGDSAKKREAQTPQQQRQQQHPQQQLPQQRKAQHPQPPQKRAPPPPAMHSSRKGGGGLLGGLLGAQRRTENHLHVVRSQKSPSDAAFDPTAGAAGVINGFRARVATALERFKADPAAFHTTVAVDHAALVRAVPAAARETLTIDAFKFAVYEQVEEVGGDQWIAAKEPAEFLDVCNIAVYKEGHCPAAVLEDLNKGDLPDEIAGQRQHLVQAQTKAIERKGKKRDEQIVRSALGSGGQEGTTELNTNKRDRRTLEQIQKDIQEGGSEDTPKRGRFDIE